MTTRHWLAAVTALLAVAACRPGEQRTDHLDPDHIEEQREQLAPEVVMHLDSGNAAYARGEHELALDHYTQATELDDEVAAAWFGIYMAQEALGNTEAAEEAMERARDFTSGTSLIHPNSPDSAR